MYFISGSYISCVKGNCSWHLTCGVLWLAILTLVQVIDSLFMQHSGTLCPSMGERVVELSLRQLTLAFAS